MKRDDGGMERDRAAKFLEANMKTIFAYALSRVSDRDDAEDLAGDIMAAVLKSAPALRDENAFLGYVWKIASNTCGSFLARRARAIAEPLDGQEETPDEGDTADGLIRGEELSLLRRELALLTKEYRECTVAYYIDGLSCAEVSEKLRVSPEMVRYYLFKTRKILREGIGMTREFGEKSYHPGKFYFYAVFSERANREYKRLFDRKLPGNILLCAYDAPASVSELSIELGVSSVYLEDEIHLLESYNLLTEVSGKYLSNLVILTSDYRDAVIKKLLPGLSDKLKSAVETLKTLLPEVRKLGFYGSDYPDGRLLWAAYLVSVFACWNGLRKYIDERTGGAYELYPGAHGIIYGRDFDTADSPLDDFAGSTNVGHSPFCSFINFKALGASQLHLEYDINEVFENAEYTGSDWEKNMISDKAAFVRDGKLVPAFPVFSEAGLAELRALLEPAVREIENALIACGSAASDMLKDRSPKQLADRVQKIAFNFIMYETVGCATEVMLNSCALPTPKNGEKVAVYGVTK